MKGFYRLASKLPLPAYWKMLLWSRSLGRPHGHGKAWPYWRCVELALRGIHGYGATFPEAESYSFIEFGVFEGEGLEQMAQFRDVLVRRLGIKVPVVVYGFDTFEGLPAARQGDEGLPYYAGKFATDYEAVARRFAKYRDVVLVRGLFSHTLPDYRATFASSPPLFVSVDCDWYSSTMDVLREVLPVAPHGSLWFFDDVALNYWASQAGEMRAIREVNEEGEYEFAEYPLHVQTGEIRHWKQVYRLARRGQTAPPAAP